MHTKIPKFENVTVGENGCIFKSDCTSLASIEAGGISVVTESGSPTYSTSGATKGITYPVVGTDKILLQTSTVQKTLMAQGTIIGFTVRNSLLTDETDLAADGYLCCSAGGKLSFRKAALAAEVVYAKADVSDFSAYRGNSEDGWARVVMHHTGKGVYAYINDYLIVEAIGTTADITTTEVSSFYIGGRGGGNASPANEPIKDFFIIAGQPLLLPYQPRFRHFNVYGDSKAALGQYAEDAGSTYQAIVGRQEDSFCTEPTNVDTDSAAIQDQSMFATIHRELAKRGMGIGNDRLHSWAESNTGFVETAVSGRNIPDLVDQSLLDKYSIPTISIIDGGTNDVSDGSTPIDATWEAAVTGVIDTLIAANSDMKIYVCTQTYRSDADHQTKLLAVNAFLMTLDSLYTHVSVIDLYASMGGTNLATPYLSADGVHLANAGNKLKGELVARAIN